jgi:hypothetical protein
MSKPESLESGLQAVPVTRASASLTTGVFQLNRRSFLVRSALGTAAALIVGEGSGVLGANDAVRIGVVGLHGRGQSHIHQATRVAGFRLAALCDVDPALLGQDVEKAKADGHPVRGFKDVRDLIASKEVDAITVATPNHWHALATIWACQAGKDVFVEKPVSHNVAEDSFCDHLARNGMNLEKQEATLGARLALDPKAERFLGNAAADALLTRAGRPPFVASL